MHYGLGVLAFLDLTHSLPVGMDMYMDMEWIRMWNGYGYVCRYGYGMDMELVWTHGMEDRLGINIMT